MLGDVYMDRNEIIKGTKRVVIKIGTSTLTHGTGLLNIAKIEKLARQIADLKNRGLEVIMVSSGAIGAGMGKLKLKERPKTIPEKQAAAAVGQGILIHMYQKIFSEYGIAIGQILLNKDDIVHRKRYLNARNTFFSLLNQDIIPIVNENDAVITEEIKLGDNDTLSALVCSLTEADTLVILSDIDGLYTDNPRTNPDAKRISIVEEVNDEIKELGKGAGSELGTGGMYTKLLAAEIVSNAGHNMIIADGAHEDILFDIFDGKELGTLFLGKKKSLGLRKHWIGYGGEPSGKLIVDAGAVKALRRNKSLLPSGVKSVEGECEKGSILEIVDPENNVVGYGISNYSKMEIELIRGHNTQDIEDILGENKYDEIIHVNNLTMV
jgi:glutamate 5-kinase